MPFSTQVILLLIAGLVSTIILRRAIPLALAHPERFPSASWGWPDAAFSGAIVAFFIWTAMASARHSPPRVDLRVIGASLALYTGLAILIVGFLIFRGINPIKAFGLQWRKWLTELYLIPAALLLALPLIYFAQIVTYRFFGPNTAPQPIVTFLLESTGWMERAVVCVAAIIVAPLTEELVFRGCLYGVIRKYAGRFAAVIGTSILFALIHGHAPSLPGLFLLAVGLALIYERTDSLWAPISLHAAFNGITIIFAILWPDIAQ